MTGLRPIKIPSAKEKVAAELRKAILSKQMKAGEALTLESVASQLSVSITPVREAFQILARDGLIKLRQNKGAVVLGISETYIKEHYQLRAILESETAKMASEQGKDISAIIESYEISCESIRKNDITNYANENRDFHNEIWTAAGNSKIKAMLSDLWNGLSLGNTVSESEYAGISIQEHSKILEAIKEHNAQKAYDEMYRHIMRSRDDMLTHYI